MELLSHDIDPFSGLDANNPFDSLLADLNPSCPVVALPDINYPLDAPAESSQQFPWPPRLCLDLALGFEDEAAVLLRHGVDEEVYEHLKRLPAFRRDLAIAAATIREEGLTFKGKCRAFAEEYLEEVYTNLYDRGISAVQRFEMFKQMVKLGGLEPKEEKAVDDFAHLPRIAIQIVLP